MNRCKQFTFDKDHTDMENTITAWLRKHDNIQILQAQWVQHGDVLHYIILYQKPYSEWDLPPSGGR